MNSPSHQKICTDLTEQGWTIHDNFLASELVHQLKQECHQQHGQGLLREAGIGQAENYAIQQSIRGDQIRWLENGMSASIDMFLAEMNKLRLLLNRQLFLGLENSEHHFALYPPGAFYQKHKDQFRHDDSRTVSSVVYLNPNWQAEHGGELRLHFDDHYQDIAPMANRLVLFMSADIWHEVLPTQVERLSLTGWFRRR